MEFLCFLIFLGILSIIGIIWTYFGIKEDERKGWHRAYK